jgi:hypothetical protein
MSGIELCYNSSYVSSFLVLRRLSHTSFGHSINLSFSQTLNCLETAWERQRPAKNSVQIKHLIQHRCL